MATADTFRNFYLGVLFFRDRRADVWVAQGLEYDISANGRTVEDAQLAFERVVSGYLTVDRRREREPFSTLHPAPQHLWAAWKRVTEKQTQELHVQNVPAYTINAISNESVNA